MQKSIIGWTNVTWNPTHGCSKVSSGCANCYAETLSLKYGHTSLPWTEKNVVVNVLLKPHKLREPYALKEPSLIFVNSMSDLFHELIPDDYRAQIFEVMNDLPQHTFQILTKRPDLAASWPGPWGTHIQMGTSVESRATLFRLDCLRSVPARVRFISFEPLLEDLGETHLEGYSWVIVGGESGAGYRPMKHSWARSIRDQCVANGVAFFFKQSAAYRTEIGTALEEEDGTRWIWNQYPGHLVSPSLVTS